jgi:hypothetical protein
VGAQRPCFLALRDSARPRNEFAWFLDVRKFIVFGFFVFVKYFIKYFYLFNFYLIFIYLFIYLFIKT